LDPALAVGDVVLDGLDALKAVEGPWKPGRIAAQADLVATPSAKALLHKQTDALAVDMESDAARRAAMLAGVPLLIVRAVTDTAGQSINPTVPGWIGPTGQVRGGTMALGLLRRPWLILELIRLWRSSRLAGKRLADAVRHVVDHAEEFAPKKGS
jgi:adenosylhomocysteine nucleosidase